MKLLNINRFYVYQLFIQDIIMEFSKGYPCEYGLTGGFAHKTPLGWQEVIKNGCSWNIANRKSGAIPYSSSEPKYEYIIVLNPSQFEKLSDLYILDAEFIEFIYRKGLHHLYIKNGGGTELFYKLSGVSYVDLRIEFLKSKNLDIIKVFEYDPYPLRSLNVDEKQTIKDEEEHNDTIKISMISKFKRPRPRIAVETLKDKFQRIFLNGKKFRRIQDELWDNVDTILQTELAECRGIIQWPTATGKTFGILIIIILLSQYYNTNNTYYRGILISPKNDIFKTIKEYITPLSEFDISILDGSDGKFSSLVFPETGSYLILACHSALTCYSDIDKLSVLNHFHYDEVHRITGDEMFDIVNTKLVELGIKHLTGTSATPETTNPRQRERLYQLFGHPLKLLHSCTVLDAVKEGWIAKPRFIVKILPKTDDIHYILCAFVDVVVNCSIEKNKGGKIIAYIETSNNDVKYALEYAKDTYPHIKFYGAIDGDRTDDDFIKSPIISDPQIMFACQRYREGSDIRGLEMTARLVGDTISSHILIQISGRALRIDSDPDKEGWCVIVKPCEEGTTEDEVLDSIVLDIAIFLGNSNRPLSRDDIQKLVETYIGELTVSGHKCSLKETIDRIQAAYLRNLYSVRTPKERYELIRSYNSEMNFKSKHDYLESKDYHPKFIDNPKVYFKDYWTNWYDFIGVDTSKFPASKHEWKTQCIELGILTWDEYKIKKNSFMPDNPSELYEDYTNWANEFGDIEELIW